MTRLSELYLHPVAELLHHGSGHDPGTEQNPSDQRRHPAQFRRSSTRRMTPAVGDARPAIVVTDTSVLINFLHIDRTDLIAGHSHDLLATHHVAAEISDPRAGGHRWSEPATTPIGTNALAFVTPSRPAVRAVTGEGSPV